MTDEKKPQEGPNKKVLLAIGAIGVGFVIYNALFNNAQQAPSTTAVPKPIEVGTDPVNSITTQDKDAALTQFAKKIESLEMKLETAEQIKAREKNEAEQRFREQQQQTNTEIRSLSEEIAKLRKEAINGVYAGVNQADSGKTGVPGALPDNLPADLSLAPTGTPNSGLNFDGGLDFDMAAPTPTASPQPANPYGPNYFILRPQAAPTKTTKNGGALNASEEEMFASMSTPTPQDFNSGAAPQSYSGTGTAPQQYAGNNGVNGYPNNATQQQAQPVGQTAGGQPVQAQGPALDKEVIPAFSFVEVTTLHGVACPIGANAPGASSANQIPARPVVLPVRGIFRGPNGSMKDTGTIHLMGLCSGRRTDSNNAGRATIRVEQMSYWDATGGAQMVATTGYIVDTRDNEQDVYGRLVKTSGRTLALQSAAAAAAAFATTMSQAEFTNQNTLNSEGGSSTTSQLTGDASKAAVAQGIAALFSKIGQRFEQEANAAVDTVIVEPGIKLRFVTDQPIEIMKPSEPFEIDASQYDVLL